MRHLATDKEKKIYYSSIRTEQLILQRYMNLTKVLKTDVYDNRDLRWRTRKELLQMSGVASMKAAVARNLLREDKNKRSVARTIA